MVGKLTAALVRKEAEAYRAQGLHEEAFALYDELLSSTPNIDEALKSDIQSKMDDIAEEMEEFSSYDENPPMSSKEISQLKVGWRQGASKEEILISAQGLCQIGAHRDALLEFTKLLKGGIAPDEIANFAAECLAKIHSAPDTPAAAEKWLRNIYTDDRKILAVHLLLIKAFSRRRDKTYAYHYCAFVRSKPNLPANLTKQLDSAKAKLEVAANRPPRKTALKSKPNNKTTKKLNAKPVDSDNSNGKSQSSEADAVATFERLLTENRENFRDYLADDGLEKMFATEPPTSTEKKERSRLHFLKLITVGWISWIFRAAFFRKKK